MSLNYSAEDVRVLATEAEMLVRSKSACENVYRKNSSEGDSEDSVHQARIQRDSVISTELNIPKRQFSPKRKLCKRKDFHQSLPNYLNYFKHHH